ncbi:MAG: Uma2 family endonuclease [bacterium]|nr:Uma2 family endonuclease [bacterium]
MEAAQIATDYELERGKPMPSRNHSIVQFNLTLAFSTYRSEYSILPELTLELGGPPLTPDISVYPKLSPDWRHDEIKMTKPPLVAVEILSPRQAMDDLVQKAETYFEAGVRSCWIVLPAVKGIAVLVPGEDTTLYSKGELKDPATEITVKVEEIFR